jgi:hypothetical protein
MRSIASLIFLCQSLLLLLGNTRVEQVEDVVPPDEWARVVSLVPQGLGYEIEGQAVTESVVELAEGNEFRAARSPPICVGQGR